MPIGGGHDHPRRPDRRPDAGRGGLAHGSESRVRARPHEGGSADSPERGAERECDVSAHGEKSHTDGYAWHQGSAGSGRGYPDGPHLARLRHPGRPRTGRHHSTDDHPARDPARPGVGRHTGPAAALRPRGPAAQLHLAEATHARARLLGDHARGPGTARGGIREDPRSCPARAPHMTRPEPMDEQILAAMHARLLALDSVIAQPWYRPRFVDRTYRPLDAVNDFPGYLVELAPEESG